VIDGWLARSKRSGKLAASRCGLAVPRQNGKNAILEAVELFKMVVQGRRILHTAHEVKTARKAFLRLCSFFENQRKYPELAALVRDIRKTNGQEAIFLTNGGSVEFIARSKGSGRGFTVDDLVCDESQELSDDALAALYPTISAAPSGDPQLILTGTPPAPNMAGDVFTRFRDAGVLGKDARLCWDEWSASHDVDLDDPAAWASVNPALGIRLGIDVIRDERAAMDDVMFGRERLGMWDELGANAAISRAVWSDCADIESTIGDRPVFALDVSPSRSWSSLAVAGKRVDGLTHVELTFGKDKTIDHRPGVDWVLPRLLELKSRWPNFRVHIFAGTAAESLVPSLEAAGITVVVLKSGETATACGFFYDLAIGRTLRHVAQPELTAALQAAAQVDVGDGAWKFARRKSSADITPLYAVVAAAWATSQGTNYNVLDSFY
jgi:phage terminase large subunit-like protein